MSARRRPIVRFLESLAIPNISLYLVIGQVAVLGLEMVGNISSYPLWLIPANVLAGEWWRIFTFILVPPGTSLIFIAFAWYLFWFMGSALEAHWGVGRYNLFLLTGWVLTVAASFVSPASVASNAFLGGSVFLAFAWLAPDFELSIFLILPVKIKWLALLAWLGYAFALATGDMAARLGVLAATGNFLVFFARDIVLTLRQRKRQFSRQSRRTEEPEHVARHRCRICGRDSMSHPELDFRYCSKCADDSCYCSEHLRNHEHVVAAPTNSQT